MHRFLPPKVTRPHGLRKRAHYFELPEKGDSLDEQNFITRMLYKNIYLTCIDLYACIEQYYSVV